MAVLCPCAPVGVASVMDDVALSSDEVLLVPGISPFCCPFAPGQPQAPPRADPAFMSTSAHGCPKASGN